MNNRAKVVTGISSAAILVFMLHLFHIVHFAAKATGEGQEYKTMEAVIILTDSATGGKDTVLLSEYMKQQQKGRR
jgi:hypothetical protein